MNIYLLRHGEAEARAHNDPARQLTARGKLEIEQVAQQFAARDIRLDRCLASPYLRASQTASLFLRFTAPDLPVETADILTPEVRASAVMDFLDGMREQHVLLVSHNPLLSELCALLTDGDISHMHILRTSELVCVAFEVMGLGMATTPFRLLPEALTWHS